MRWMYTLLACCAVLAAMALSAPAQDAPMRMVYAAGFAPLSYAGEHGQAQGILPDIMRAALDELGVASSHQALDWAEAQRMVRDGRADGFVTVPTATRREYALVGGTPVLSVRRGLFCRAGDVALVERLNAVRQPSDLAGEPMLDYAGDGSNLARFEGADMTVLDDLDQVLAAVAEGRGVFVQNELVVWAEARRLGLHDDIAQARGAQLGEAAFHLCVGKSSPHAGIFERFEAVIGRMAADGEVRAAVDRHRMGPLE